MLILYNHKEYLSTNQDSQPNWGEHIGNPSGDVFRPAPKSQVCGEHFWVSSWFD
jgi:hypothetical protein